MNNLMKIDTVQPAAKGVTVFIGKLNYDVNSGDDISIVTKNNLIQATIFAFITMSPPSHLVYSAKNGEIIGLAVRGLKDSVESGDEIMVN